MKSSLTKEQIADLYADLLNEVEELINVDILTEDCDLAVRIKNGEFPSVGKVPSRFTDGKRVTK